MPPSRSGQLSPTESIAPAISPPSKTGAVLVTLLISSPEHEPGLPIETDSGHLDNDEDDGNDFNAEEEDGDGKKFAEPGSAGVDIAAYRSKMTCRVCPWLRDVHRVFLVLPIPLGKSSNGVGSMCNLWNYQQGLRPKDCVPHFSDS